MMHFFLGASPWVVDGVLPPPELHRLASPGLHSRCSVRPQCAPACSRLLYIAASILFRSLKTRRGAAAKNSLLNRVSMPSIIHSCAPVRLPCGFLASPVRLSCGSRAAFSRLHFGSHAAPVRFQCGFLVAPVRLPCGSRAAFSRLHFGSHAAPVRFQCGFLVAPVRLPCGSNATPMPLPCGFLAAPMQLPCGSHAAPVRLPCGSHMSSHKIVHFQGHCKCGLIREPYESRCDEKE